MRPSCAWPVFCLLLATATAADAAELQQLRHNPFSRPEIVNEPPPPPPPPVTVSEEPELELSATLVSKVAPMVVVNGELLEIGEDIDGLRLVAVAEGRATFERDGRKFTFELKQLLPR
ncbi:MAG: hypothetical protein QNJ85_01730 [Gammaproteobacteria bacterium]|nr:hypothetical protein [Gammaproteobacteria bacterium]